MTRAPDGSGAAVIFSPYLTTAEAASYLLLPQRERDPHGRAPRPAEAVWSSRTSRDAALHPDDLDAFGARHRVEPPEETDRATRQETLSTDPRRPRPRAGPLPAPLAADRSEDGELADVRKRVRCASLAEAVHLREELIAEFQAGRSQASRVRLDDYATSWILGKLPTLKVSTRRTYSDALDKHILPTLGRFYLDALSPDELRRWFAEKAARYAPATANCFLRVLKIMLADACEEHDLRNPTSRIRSIPELRYRRQRRYNMPHCRGDEQVPRRTSRGLPPVVRDRVHTVRHGNAVRRGLRSALGGRGRAAWCDLRAALALAYAHRHHEDRRRARGCVDR